MRRRYSSVSPARSLSSEVDTASNGTVRALHASRTVYLHNMQSRHAAEEGLGVDVCLTKENLESAPECPHGKLTLMLFATKQH